MAAFSRLRLPTAVADRALDDARMRRDRVPRRLREATHKRSLGLSGRWKMLLLAVYRGRLGRGLGTTTLHGLYLPLFAARSRSRTPGTRSFPRDRGRHERDNLTDGSTGSRRHHAHRAFLPGVNVVSYVRSGPPGHGCVRCSTSRCRRGADRRRGRLPLVQRLPRRGVHGRHRLLASAARSGRSVRGRWSCCFSSSAALRDRGALGDHPGILVQPLGRRIFLMAPSIITSR